LVVRLEQDGHYGLGEATVNDFYGASVASMTHALESVRSGLNNLALTHPSELWQQLDPQLAKNRFAQCALDCAAWDLWAKSHSIPARQAMGIDQHESLQTKWPVSCFTIGMDQPVIMLQKLQEMPGWPVYKIKLGGQYDLEILELLRANTPSRFRVDANCGWTVDTAEKMLEQLAELDVELVEQPLPVGDPNMSDLVERSPLLLMADESCEEESDVDGCHGQFHAINIKLVKCGGLTPALRMIRRARQLGLKVMVGCMTESSIGISAAAQLVPLLDFADMDGAVLLGRDIAEGASVNRGHIQLDDANGLGVEMLPEAEELEVHACTP
jgi:L-alanine-DL-glutamate epimerase-like enolase superfamily enzyme